MATRVLLLLLAVSALAGGPARAQDGGQAPAPPPGPGAADNRFFPKEMEDALAALEKPDPEDSFNEGLQVLGRLRMRDGGPEGLRRGAYTGILRHALGSRLEYVTSFGGEILASLDMQRLLQEMRETAEKETDARRLYNAAVLLEETVEPPAAAVGQPGPVETLVRLASKPNDAVRGRAVEALGEVASARRGCPEKVREKAAGTVLGFYGSGLREPAMKNLAAIALGKIGHPRAIPSLLSGLVQSDRKHGYFCALALSWIEDPSVFPALAGTGANGGEALEAWAKAMEACARPDNVESLLNTLQQGGKPEAREAAAIALGRILVAFPLPVPAGSAGPPSPDGGTVIEERERGAFREKASRALFDRMVSDPSERVAWACFHAVSRCGGPWLAEDAVKLLQSPKADNVARAIHLCGTFQAAAAAKTLAGGITSIREDLMRKRCALEFWRCADATAVKEFEEKVKGMKGGPSFARACDALGNRRTADGFRFALDLLRAAREKSPEAFEVELCLEKMTGHFFGPYPATWNRWFEKNPEFFSRRGGKIEREKWRDEFDKENKGFRQTKETEKAVQMGLEYLARHQDADGAWDPQGFRSHCDREPACSAGMGARVQEDAVSRTGLCALAFLGAGYTPEGGKFKTALRRGLEYLMARQQACGDYLTNDLIGGYNRPVALQAYAEAGALTRDPRYLPFVQRGADFLMQIQNQIGGWRYRVDVETSDSSVAAWMLFAMKAAEKAGADVPPIVFEGCRMLFQRYSVHVPPDGPREDLVDIDPAYGFEVGKEATYEFRTGYQDQAYAPTHATTALGLMSHILLGYRRSHPFCIGSANHVLRKQLPEAPKDNRWERLNIKQEYPMYFLYYGTLAMHQMGGKYFRTWNEQVRAILPGTQIQSGCARGAWNGANIDGVFGSLYTTPTGVLTLETYYRYLPVLQD